MNLEVNGAFVYFEIPLLGGDIPILGSITITQTTVSFTIVALLLMTLSILLGRNLQKRPTGVQVLVEKGVSMIRNLTVSVMGEHNESWTPFMATIFLSSLFGSLIGLTGFLRSATADLSCVLVWAVMVSVVIWRNNIKHNGFLGWLKGFTEPIVVMTPMNIVSEIAQPFSMAFRHFGNVAGGGVISAIVYTACGLASTLVLNVIASVGWIVSAVLIALGVAAVIIWRKKWVVCILGGFTAALGVCGLLQALGILSGVPILALGVPAVLSCYFDLFSGFIQALVFTLLSMVYISGSLPVPEAGQQDK